MSNARNMISGSVDYDESGEFEEFRASGVRLVRLSPEELRLETTGGDEFSIISKAIVSVHSENDADAEVMPAGKFAGMRFEKMPSAMLERALLLEVLGAKHKAAIKKVLHSRAEKTPGNT